MVYYTIPKKVVTMFLFRKVHVRKQYIHKEKSGCVSNGQKVVRLVAHTQPDKNDAIKEQDVSHVKKIMDESLQEAFDVCDHDKGSTKECLVAWDTYWDLEHAYFDKWEKWVESKRNPLDSFCEKNPWAVECKMYDV